MASTAPEHASAPSDPSPDALVDESFRQAAFGLEADLAFIHACARIAESSKQEGPVILLATGIFNPPHRGHLEMMRIAREVLVDAGIVVAGAVLVPSSDQYVRRKVFHDNLDMSWALPFQLRSQLLLAMAAGVGLGGLMHISDAEQSRGLFYVAVAQSLSCEVKSDKLPSRIVFVTGSDRPHPLEHHFDGIDGGVVVPRAGADVSRLKERLDGNPLWTVSAATQGTVGLSSTRLREALLTVLQGQRADGHDRDSGHQLAEAALSEFMTPSAAALLLNALAPRGREAP